MRIAPRHRGIAAVYGIFSLTVIVGFTSLGVDMARCQIAKVQLRHIARAAALYAAEGISEGVVGIRSRASTAAADNNVSVIGLAAYTINTTNDVEVGLWDTTTKTFTPGSFSVSSTSLNPALANAVRITTRLTRANGNPVPLIFGKIIGMPSADITLQATAMVTNSPTTVRGDTNLWLAGMPNGNYGGSSVSGTAPENSPVQVQNVTLTAGSKLSFTVSGSCSDDPVNIHYGWTPDGQPGGVRTNDSGYLNGMSQLTTQQASLVGVFLDDNVPTSSAAPSALDQSTQAAMDYKKLSPELKQPFFIGDGRTSGGAVQQIVVPAGATRLYLGDMDNINWANDSGYFLVSIGTTSARVEIVK